LIFTSRGYPKKIRNIETGRDVKLMARWERRDDPLCRPWPRALALQPRRAAIQENLSPSRGGLDTSRRAKGTSTEFFWISRVNRPAPRRRNRKQYPTGTRAKRNHLLHGRAARCDEPRASEEGLLHPSHKSRQGDRWRDSCAQSVLRARNYAADADRPKAACDAVDDDPQDQASRPLSDCRERKNRHPSVS